jgi:hypothetical protein
MRKLAVRQVAYTIQRIADFRKNKVKLIIIPFIFVQLFAPFQIFPG